ncbi:ABC transporter substrate-binding protein [Paracoccus sp. (in: a-proteobacteria)]|uniref:ABC transporter substrate-binding protein n=1 Tax=Paracoccus sp. TaxID=267 RepID=UPI002AFEA901|nr:ABC transporter substrate-binding protein [Paracoccus sp. (in: a-proteobacteria)]
MSFFKYASSLLMASALSLGALSAQAETIRIGLIGSLTGGGAAWGQAMHQGAKIAADRKNAAGGITVGDKTYDLEVIAYDDHYKAADAVGAYNRLVHQDGARFVVLMGSAGALAVKQNVEDDQILALTSAYSTKVIDDDTRYMFRLFSTAHDYARGLIEWTAENHPERRIVVLNPNDETGWDQQQVTEPIYRELGYEILAAEQYERTLQDFQPLFTKILALNPDIVDFGSTSPATAGLMTRQIREMGYKGKLTKTGGAGPEEIVAAAGPEAAEGMISVLYADPANPGFQDLMAAYKENTGHDGNAIIVAFYDAINVLIAAMEASEDPADASKVAEAFATALPATSVQGDPLTPGSLSADGKPRQILTTMYVGQIENGEAVSKGAIQ